MDRIVGYIDLNNILEVDIRFTDIYSFVTYLRKNKTNIKVVPYSVTSTKFMITFEISNDKYYFKFDDEESPYAELIAEEIAKSMHLPCIDYDIATIGGFIGNISKDYTTKDEIGVIKGESVIEHVHKDKELSKVFGPTNNLETIWMSLVDMFKNYDNCNEIVTYLMKKIVDMYVFDIITKQDDRHSDNWEIVKYRDGHYDLRPLFDNARILFSEEEKPNILLRVTHKTMNLEDNIRRFIRISSSEFKELIEENLWVISEENISYILEKVEKKIGYKMPAVVRERYQKGFKNHLIILETCLENDKLKRKGV